MKVVILAGGFGTRMAEYTKTIPKPMVSVNGKPILVHIIEQYLKYGFSDFYLSIGYKSNVIAKYFLKKKVSISKLKKGISIKKKINNKICKITLVFTGNKTMTGGRIKKLTKFLDKETFMCTYGDGLSNINLKKLVKFHNTHRKLATVTAVRPRSRFGKLDIKGNIVKNFKEKPEMESGWINGGFFVFNPNFLKLIKNDNTVLEKEPLEKASKSKNLFAFKHESFWHCMDTKRDRDNLAKILKKNEL